MGLNHTGTHHTANPSYGNVKEYKVIFCNIMTSIIEQFNCNK